MRSKTLGLIGIVAALVVATTIVSYAPAAFALRAVGAPQSQGATNGNGINANVGVQAQVGGICVNALTTQSPC